MYCRFYNDTYVFIFLSTIFSCKRNKECCEDFDKRFFPPLMIFLTKINDLKIKEELCKIRCRIVNVYITIFFFKTLKI